MYLSKIKFLLETVRDKMMENGLEKAPMIIILQYRALYVLNQIAVTSYKSELLYLQWSLSYVIIVAMLAKCIRVNVRLPTRLALYYI